jgi:hypothetical protein
MKLYARMRWLKIDTGIDGEDFDNEVESQLEGLDVEGWELASVSVSREKKKQKPELVRHMQNEAQKVLAGDTECVKISGLRRKAKS